MSRHPRDTGAGIFHVFTHCVWVTRELYRTDDDRMDFLRRLARVTDDLGWTCLAYCLMTSHYHLIVEVTDGLLPKAMHRLNLGYVRDFNRKYVLRGHLQYEAYGARRIDGDADLAYRFKYLANNPVEAGLCETPGNWPWSSYAGTVDLAPPATFVDAGRILRYFAQPDGEPAAALRRYVEES
jgi:REP element-mobilizing transposase RayT